VVVEGLVHPPGAAPRTVALELDGRAISSEEIEARFTEAALAAAGGRGTLRGRVTVRFDAAGGGAVLGRSPPVVLDVMPPSAEQLADELARRRRAALFLERLGVALAEEGSGENGLRVTHVEQGSVAARAGLAQGDRLAGIDGVRVRSVSDLVSPPGREEARVTVSREGETTFVIVVPAGERTRSLSDAELNAVRAALAWVLLVLLFLAPTAALTEAVAQRPESARSTRGSAFEAARIAVGAALLAGLVALDHASLLRARLELAVAFALAVRTSSAYLAARGSGASTLRALGASTRALGAVALVALALGAVAAIGGTTDIVALHEQQDPAPWTWTALRAPAGPLLTGLLVVLAAPETGRGQAGELASDLVTLVLAAVVATVLLGGWNVDDAAGPWARGFATAAFVAKGLVAWALMRRAGAIRWNVRRLAALALITVAALVMTAFWIVREPAPELERALAEVLAGAVAAAMLWLVYRRLAAGHDGTTEPAPAHPFL
jgi:hypothetical protein